MNDAYDDPFLPLPSLPPTSPRPEAVPDIMMADVVHSESAACRGKRENEESDFTVDFDAFSLKSEVMQSESDDDCSEESDIDVLDNFQANPFLYEPINLFSAQNEDGGSNKKQATAQEDSLSALPVMSSTSSIKGYVNIGQSHISASEHGTSLSATSYNSGATGEEAAGSQPGYNFYTRPQSYTLKRPSYAVEKNNFWETQSAQSLHSSHSVTSTQSAPVLSGRANGSVGRFPITKFEESEAITARTTTCSSIGNENGIDSSETYSFYSRPSTNYKLQRPAYALNRASSDNNLSQYGVDSSINMDKANGLVPETSLNNVETSSNDFPMPSLSLSEHYNNLKSRRSSRKFGSETESGNIFIREKSFDNVSVKSMPAPDIPKLGQQVFSHPRVDHSNDEFNLDALNGLMPETSLNNVETSSNDFPMPSLSLSEHYNNLKSRRSSRKFGSETESGNIFIREKSFDNVSVKSMPAPDIPKLGQQVFSHPRVDHSNDKSLENSPVQSEDLQSNENSMEDATIEVKSQLEGIKLVTESDKLLATAFSHAVLSEYGRAAFRESDRQGKRKGLEIGFPGMSCIHCNGQTKKSGRFFPSSIKTMADTKKTLMSIHNHLIKCSSCPQSVKDKIIELKESHEDERKTQKYGSQKAFFSNIWERLHG